MHDLALHLCERVIPSVPLRQWVLAVPRALRLPLARDAARWRAVVGIAVRTIFALQRRQARALGLGRVMPGAVTFLHQAGGALNLTPHQHSAVPDGVFVALPEQPALFVELPPPTQREVEVVLATSSARSAAVPSRSSRSSPSSLSCARSSRTSACPRASRTAPARLPKELGFDFEADDHRRTETDEPEPASVPRGRGPPPPRPSCP